MNDRTNAQNSAITDISIGPDANIEPKEPRLNHPLWWPILAGGLAGLLLRFVFSGTSGEPYSAMLGSFIYGAPIMSAAISTWLSGPERRLQLGTCMTAGGFSASLVVVGALMVFIEGWICALIILPFFFIVGMLTGLVMWMVYRLLDKLIARRAVYSFAALPLILGAIEPSMAPPPYEYHETVQTTFIHASPDVVWANVVQTKPIETRFFEHSYASLLGVPAPVKADTVQNAQGQWVRHMQWDKGVHFYGDVTDWQPGKKLSWNYRFAADSFPAGAMDDHVTLTGEHFELTDGSYTLTAKNGGTELTETTRWRISTQFNAYSRFLGEVLIADTVSHLVDIMKIRSEQDAKTSIHRVATN